MSWLSEIIKGTQEWETPEEYIKWGALCAISGVVKKNVWLYLPGNQSKLYANLYCMIIGKSGNRKGAAIAMARKLVNGVGNTRVITGKTSIQAMIQELSQTATKEGGGAPMIDAQCFAIVPEFSGFLVEDSSSFTTLIDLYDTEAWEDGYPYRTKGSGTQMLKNPSITMFSASNRELLDMSLPQAVAAGGFISRTISVINDGFHKVNALMDEASFTMDYKSSVDYLKKVALLRGPMKMAPTAKEQWIKWYENFRKATEKTHDPNGILMRLSDNILKTAMILSLANDLNMEISVLNLDEATELCLDAARKTHRMSAGRGKNPLGPAMGLILEELTNKEDHKIKRNWFIKRYWQHFNAKDLDEIIEMLEQTGWIDIVMNGKDTTIELNSKGVEGWQILKKEQKGKALDPKMLEK
jgi:hypothetical protein